MPVYDYLCERCGPFTELRPMADYEQPNECPRCGRKAPRALLTAPYFAAMPTERRSAHATNEQSRHAPSMRSQMTTTHGAGCRCCAEKKSMRTTKRGRNGAKSFPASRPWMISH